MKAIVAALSALAQSLGIFWSLVVAVLAPLIAYLMVTGMSALARLIAALYLRLAGHS
jgi:Flp pilus assembly pilin Flp